MGSKGIIFVHGTSQDAAQQNETIYKLAGRAKMSGVRWVCLDGVGSTGRAIKDLTAHSPEWSQPLSDEPDLMLDYLYEWTAGTIWGRRISDLSDEITAHAMEMMRDGVDDIQMVGFSRGAVAIAMAAEGMGKKLKRADFKGSLSLTLLDPVPGSFRVPQSIKIPDLFENVKLYTSIHEARPCFQALSLQMSPGTKFTGETFIGVHGDIGGSTKRGMTDIVFDDLARALDLNGPFLSQEARMGLLLGAMTESSYSQPGMLNSMLKRRFLQGYQGYDTALPGLPMWHIPSSMHLGEMMGNPGVRDLISEVSPREYKEYDWDKHDKQINQLWQARFQNPVTLMTPRPSSVSASGRVIHYPPMRRMLRPLLKKL